MSFKSFCSSLGRRLLCKPQRHNVDPQVTVPTKTDPPEETHSEVPANEQHQPEPEVNQEHQQTKAQRSQSPGTEEGSEEEEEEPQKTPERTPSSSKTPDKKPSPPATPRKSSILSLKRAASAPLRSKRNSIANSLREESEPPSPARSKRNSIAKPVPEEPESSTPPRSKRNPIANSVPGGAIPFTPVSESSSIARFALAEPDPSTPSRSKRNSVAKPVPAQPTSSTPGSKRNSIAKSAPEDTEVSSVSDVPSEPQEHRISLDSEKPAVPGDFTSDSESSFDEAPEPEQGTKLSSKSVSFEHSNATTPMEDDGKKDLKKDDVKDEKKKEKLRAVVDMGSNGIRFSITDLDPKTARILPTVFQDRCGVSLYDAQYQQGKKVPIPAHVIEQVITELKKFKKTCETFGVLNKNVRFIATEATRGAINSEEYRQKLEEATDWKVEMLPKEEEGRVGAMGVASSFSTVRGLVMDLGGGSTQLTWLIMENGNIRMSPKGSISLPYGAAALTQRMAVAMKDSEAAMERVGDEVTSSLIDAVSDLDIPQELLETAQAEGGLKLYLSGGGYRGWGYLLMSAHVINPYPIPLINGFSIAISSFKPEVVLKGVGREVDEGQVFRVSKRRAAQVPAVAFLIDSLLNALPDISHIYFAQGGVREGILFSSLPAEVQALHPLNAATSPYAPQSTPNLVQLFRRAIPDVKLPQPTGPDTPQIPSFLKDNDILITSLVHLMSFHAPLPKDSQAVAGLRSTTAGVLAGVHGLSHEMRALVALALCKRWGGEIAPVDRAFHQGLTKLVGGYDAWWAEFAGVIAAAIGDCYPAGLAVDHAKWIRSRWETRDECKHGRDNIELLLEVEVDRDAVADPGWFKDFEKLGKRKRWLEGEGVRTKIVSAKSGS